MRVTVAICTWNRCELLRETLEQLTRASLPPDADVDFVVVNNNCTDGTDAVIEEFRGRLPLRRIFEPTPGVAYSRNAALASATGEYVVFVDDDALVDPGWLVEFAAGARAYPDAAAIGGIIDPWFPQEPDPDLLEVFPGLKMGFCGLDHKREPGPLPDDKFVWGPNMALRLAALKDLRFNPAFGANPTSTMGGDEPDLLGRVRAAGGSVIWWPNMRIRHYVLPSRMTLEYLLKFSAGKGSEQSASAPPDPSAMLFGAPRWMWRRWAGAYLRYGLAMVTPTEVGRYATPLSGPFDARGSRRRRMISWRREIAFLRGMIRGAGEQRRRRQSGPETAASSGLETNASETVTRRAS